MRPGPPTRGDSRLEDGFAKVAHSASLLGRIPGLRLVPFNTKIPSESASANYVWVGENTAKPVSKLAFIERLDVERLESLGIVVVSAELRALGHVRHRVGAARYVDPRLDRFRR